VQRDAVQDTDDMAQEDLVTWRQLLYQPDSTNSKTVNTAKSRVVKDTFSQCIKLNTKYFRELYLKYFRQVLLTSLRKYKILLKNT